MALETVEVWEAEEDVVVEELAEEQILEVIRKQVKLSTAVVASGENISLNHNFLRPPDNLNTFRSIIPQYSNSTNLDF